MPGDRLGFIGFFTEADRVEQVRPEVTSNGRPGAVKEENEDALHAYE